MIPSGELRIECAAVNPQKPIGIHVLVDGKPVAVLTLDQLKIASDDLARLELARSQK